MKVKKIRFIGVNTLSEIEDIENATIDVYVELLGDNNIYLLILETYKYVLNRMNNEGLNYNQASPPTVIVRRLTKSVIQETVNQYSEKKAYWLKYYNAGGKMEISVLEQWQNKWVQDDEIIDWYDTKPGKAEELEESKEDLLYRLDELFDNYDSDNNDDDDTNNDNNNDDNDNNDDDVDKIR
jgi:hypothetical protein